MVEENKVTINDDMDPWTVSGARNSLYLDPEIREVYLFSCVGSGIPVQAFNGVHLYMGSVNSSTHGKSLKKYLHDHVEQLSDIADLYRGTEWDGQNFRGTWDEGAADAHMLLDLDSVPTVWGPADWFRDHASVLIDRLIQTEGNIKEVAETETYAAQPDAFLDIEDVIDYLQGLWDEIPEAPHDGTWITPPENQGQIVETSYLIDCSEYAYMRVQDRSVRRVSYYRSEITGAEQETWDPINTEPEIDADWVRCR